MRNLRETLERLKEKEGLEIIDTHVHPFDVMGVVDFKESLRHGGRVNFLLPTPPEHLRHNALSAILIKTLFTIAPGTIRKSIATSFKYSGAKRLLEEMKAAGIDRSVLIPIEPAVTTQSVADTFKGDAFMVLGSLDLHNVPLTSVRSVIKLHVERYRIKGIKLHPNLQNFYPQPSRNSNEMKEKLECVYRAAGEFSLYIVFHAGYTNLLPEQKHNGFATNKALLENFCDSGGKSEVFEILNGYGVPIILAHGGHYATLRKHLNLLQVISTTYSNVFFDTAGISPKLIKLVLRIVGSKRLIFGSDALYDRMIYALWFVYTAAAHTQARGVPEETLIHILGRNFKESILRSR